MNSLQARDRFEKFSLTASGYARDAEDLSRTRRESHVVKDLHPFAVLATEPFDKKSVYGVFGLRSFYIETDFFPDHHFGQFSLVRIFRVDRSDIFAFSENGNLVGKFKHFMKFVRDYYYGFPVLFHLSEDREKSFRFLRRKHGGRFVEDQYVRASVKDFYDLNGLFFGNRHIRDVFHRVDLETVSLADLADLFDALFRVEFLIIKPEYDIFRRGEHIYKLEMLMYHSDAV